GEMGGQVRLEVTSDDVDQATGTGQHDTEFLADESSAVRADQVLAADSVGGSVLRFDRGGHAGVVLREIHQLVAESNSAGSAILGHAPQDRLQSDLRQIGRQAGTVSE